MDVLYTVGYEGARLNDFVEQLKELHIQLVVDVRVKVIINRFSTGSYLRGIDGGGMNMGASTRHF